MLGTFGGALKARQIDASRGRLTADVTGEVETEEGVLVNPAHPRSHAPESTRTGERNRGARTRQLPDALPPLQDTAPSNPAHFLVSADTRSGLVRVSSVFCFLTRCRLVGSYPHEAQKIALGFY